MAYVRKTHDEYEIHEWVPDCGWEYSCTEETWADAKAQAKCYRTEGIEVKIIKKRVKNEEE